MHLIEYSALPGGKHPGADEVCVAESLRFVGSRP